MEREIRLQSAGPLWQHGRMPDLLWREVENFFDPNLMGQLPDLWVPDASVEDWQAVFDLIRSNGWVWEYEESGTVRPLPAAAEVLPLPCRSGVCPAAGQARPGRAGEFLADVRHRDRFRREPSRAARSGGSGHPWIPAIVATLLEGRCDGWNPSGGVLGDVCQPHRVRNGSSEVASDEVVMDRRAGFPVQPAFLDEHAPDPLR